MQTSSGKTASLIEETSQLITRSSHRVALTGAGLSTPSGIPDFRSTGSGLWTRYDPLEVASLSAFRYHPERFFEWLRPLVKNMLAARPNPAHTSLAALESAGFLQGVITQNIDTLHQRAGSQRVLEVHGTIETLTCTGCYQQIAADQRLLQALIDRGTIPRCPDCGEVLKPDVVLFQEQLPFQTWNQARDLSRTCDLMLVLGSSLTVTPVSQLPHLAHQHGAELIIINQSPTHLDSQARVVIHDDLADVLPQVQEKVCHD